MSICIVVRRVVLADINIVHIERRTAGIFEAALGEINK